MRNTFKTAAIEFIAQNPDLKRAQYINAFMEIGMTENSASIYHYLHVTKVKKQTKILVKTGPVRDPKTGRFVKRAA